MLPRLATLNTALPPTVWVPLSVMLVAFTVNVPVPTLTVPRSITFTSVTVTSLAPLLLRLTAPVKSFEALVSVMALAPALKLETPVTLILIMPLWVMSPLALTVRPPEVTETAARSIAPVSVTATAPVPLLLRLTVPPPEVVLRLIALSELTEMPPLATTVAAPLIS